MTASAKETAMNVPAEFVDLQSTQWRMRMLAWFIARVPEGDKETAMEMLLAGMSVAQNEGLDESANIVDRLATETSGDFSYALCVAAKALRDLAAMNMRDFP